MYFLHVTDHQDESPVTAIARRAAEKTDNTRPDALTAAEAIIIRMCFITYLTLVFIAFSWRRFILRR